MTATTIAPQRTAKRQMDSAPKRRTLPVPVVVDTTRSAVARLHPVPITAIQLNDTFWWPRLRLNREVTLPSQYQTLEEKGRLDNFRRAAGKKDIPFQGVYYFNDTDVYKWLEAASWSLATNPNDTALREQVEDAISVVADAQDADGYLNTYFSVDRAKDRWTNFDLHEMYCAGHLFQAAVAHFRATHSTRLLDIASRLADHLCDHFGPEEEGKRNKLDAHPEVEMALVELYRATGNRRYLTQAQFFLDARGHGLLGRPYKYFNPDYAQDHVPFRELDKVTGHAVRMMYLDCGAADIYAETGETALKTALERQWANMVERRIYITGSVGARGDGESFGKDYQLPSATAYAETCAAIGSILWNYRMLQITGEARFADLLERTLYNGMLSGLSLDGGHYFYENPLSDDGLHRRQSWFECACCPPNVARLLASLPGYFASISPDGVWFHLYATSAGQVTLPDGNTVGWNMKTDYPWDGVIEVELTDAPTTPIALQLRIPNWSENATLTFNGMDANTPLNPGSYCRIERVWKNGDTLRLTLPMPVQRFIGHPNVVDTCGRLALTRGPLVYCIEHADHPDTPLETLLLPADTTLEAVWHPDLLGGVMVLEGEGRTRNLSEWQHTLYRPIQNIPDSPHSVARFTAVPYYAWGNRSPGAMSVWIPMA